MIRLRNGDEGKEDVGVSAKDATDTRISATISTSRTDDRAELVNRQEREFLGQQGKNEKRKPHKSEKKKRHDDVSYTTNTEEKHATTLANDKEKLHKSVRKVESLESEVTTLRKEMDALMLRRNGDECKEDVRLSAKDATDTRISAIHSTSRQDGRAELGNRQAQKCLEEQGENGEMKSQKSEKIKRHDDVSYATNMAENHATNLTNDKEKLHEYERKVESLKSEVIKLRNEKDAWMNRQSPKGLEQQHEDGAKNPQETKEEKKFDDDSYTKNTDENYTTDLEIDRKKFQEYERKVESLEADVMKLKTERDTLQNRHDDISYTTNTDENHTKDFTNDRKYSNEYERKVGSLEADIVKLRKEKDALLNRLSEIGAIKLTERNPNVTDLSDKNRPENLVEQLSEIYDNEWTDAYENLTKRQCQQKDLSVKQLLDVLKETYTICSSSTKKKKTALREAISNYLGLPKDATDLDLKETEKRIRDYRKKTLERNISILDEEVRGQLKSKLEKEIYEFLSDYIGKCVTICCNMCTKDPPMYLDFGDWKQTSQSGDETPANMPFDKLKFVTYTKSGDYIDYVVWPAVYLYENGPLMRKGVAQGFK
ncbi:hypothetical protein CHS0354_035500 [Potamilus streckersoni]|uniref:Mitochondria-eating protein C-terminal domain-containing protein n=1 Tax=Potamilus streckersoni TaxID=2493646 RepID=A0AAE0RVS7_9BIVA|nr:hypothetical protein CHS0354_035500 [Potamilus streckersoni]